MTLDAQDVARLVGRSQDWVRSNYATLPGFPAPIITGGQLTWDRLHIEMWLDRNLTPAQRRAAAAIRLAERALTDEVITDVLTDRAALDRELLHDDAA